MMGAPRVMGGDSERLQALQTEAVALREQKKLVWLEIGQKEGRPGNVPFPPQRQPSMAMAALPAPLPSPAQPYHGGGGFGGGGASAKRQGSFSQGGPDVKRQRAGESEDWRRHARTIINKFLTNSQTGIFRQPVKVKEVPTYHQYISHPMDLGTIKTKLTTGAYHTSAQFGADMRLVWSNCATFNGPGAPVRILGDGLSELFEREWARTGVEEQQWNHAQAPAAPAAVQQQVARLIQQEYRPMLRPLLARQPAPGLPPGAEATDMGSDERRRLSVELSELPSDRLAECLRVVEQLMPGVLVGINPEQELELELEALSDEVCWRLKDVVDTHKGRRRAGGAGPGPGSGAAAAAGGGGGGRLDPRAQPPAPPAQQQQHHGGGYANGGGQHHDRNGGGGARNGAAAERGDGSDDDSQGPHEVKGSTADEQNPSAFVRPGMPVAESGVASKNHKSAFVGSQATRKADVPKVNPVAWSDLGDVATNDANGNGAGGSGADAAAAAGGVKDELWDDFKSRDDLQQQKVQHTEDLKKKEQDRRDKELHDRHASATAEQARLVAEEARVVAHAAAQREAQKAQELLDLQSRAGTASMLHQPDDLMPQIDAGYNVDQVGLQVLQDDVDFDD